LPKYLKVPREPVATVDAKALAKEFGVTRDELSTMHSSGLLELVPSARGGLRVAEEDAWVIRLYGEVKACGFDRCPGFSPDDFAVYDAFLEDLFAREKNLFLERMDGLPSEDVVQLLEKALPFIHTFLARRHETRIRRFFETMESILQTHRGQVQDP
jgi:hypothetical protein